MKKNSCHAFMPLDPLLCLGYDPGPWSRLDSLVTNAFLSSSCQLQIIEKIYYNLSRAHAQLYNYCLRMRIIQLMCHGCNITAAQFFTDNKQIEKQRSLIEIFKSLILIKVLNPSAGLECLILKNLYYFYKQNNGF